MRMMRQALENDVRNLATASGRCVGTPGHDAARRYLLGRLSSLGLEPYHPLGFELPYRSAGQDFVNVLGRIPGKQPQLAPLLLGAHYDTAGAQPGADDNAAAVAILLAACEVLLAHSLERPVLLALFDAEEPPCFLSSAMGSTVFYTQQRTEDIHCAIILDLVGHDVPVPGLEDLVFITGMETDEGLAQILQVPIQQLCEWSPRSTVMSAT